jgi:hypothetical protein
MKPAEIDRIVAEIDRTRAAEHFRNPDRPAARTFHAKPGRRVPVEIVRAQTRLRAAAWRIRMDSRAAPDSREVGMALVYSLITSRLSEMTVTDRDLVGRALAHLNSRGYSIEETKKTLRRMRNRYVEPADRQDEASETTGPALRFASKPEENEPPF